jgi:hypothetical protein
LVRDFASPSSSSTFAFSALLISANAEDPAAWSSSFTSFGPDALALAKGDELPEKLPNPLLASAGADDEAFELDPKAEVPALAEANGEDEAFDAKGDEVEEKDAKVDCGFFGAGAGVAVSAGLVVSGWASFAFSLTCVLASGKKNRSPRYHLFVSSTRSPRFRCSYSDSCPRSSS